MIKIKSYPFSHIILSSFYYDEETDTVRSKYVYSIIYTFDEYCESLDNNTPYLEVRNNYV